MARPHLSPSQVSLYTQCGIKWERQYVRGERTAPNGYMVRGTALDEAATEHYRLRAKGQAGLTLVEFTDLAIAVHDRLVAKGDVLLDVKPEVSRSGLYKAASGYYHEIATKLEPRSHQDIQRRYVVTLEDFDVVGIVDLIIKSGAVIDSKLKQNTPYLQDTDNNLQLSTYAWMTGAKALALAVAEPSGKASLLWTTRDEADVERVKRFYGQVWAAIQAGVAVPSNPESRFCSEKWCQFWASCPFGGGK